MKISIPVATSSNGQPEDQGPDIKKACTSNETGLPLGEEDVLVQPLGVGERQQPESESGEESEQEGAVKDPSMAQPKDSVGMADVLSLFERMDTRRREDEARRYEEERTREERRREDEAN